MSLDCEPLSGMPSSERLSVIVTFEPITFKIPKVLYLTISGFAMTLTSEI